jgi:hypothetical protein
MKILREHTCGEFARKFGLCGEQFLWHRRVGVARQEDITSLDAVRRDSTYPNKSLTSQSILEASCSPLERET